ncbi:MAG: hypothetical protein HXX09_07360 [Bacteroidetes bacterium]|nr:hypothetical protein [Bacteroidota bacterium]
MKNLKSYLLVLLVALMVMPVFNGCKKGENDPGFSLRTRDNRITAKWTLTKIEGTQTDVTVAGISVTTTRTTTYDGTTKIVTSTSSLGGSSTSTGTGTYVMEILQDGQMTWSETYTSGGSSADVQTSSGTWEWLDSDNNKSVVLLDGGNHLFSGGIWRIDRLAHDELVVFDKGDSNDNGSTSNWDYKYTFTVK